MIIDEITITAEASKAYQKYCVAIKAQDLDDGDIEILKRTAISEALKGIDELAGNVDTKPEVKVNTTQPTNNNNHYSQQKQHSYRTNTPPIQHQPVQNNQPAQTMMINGFNYKLCKNNQTGELFYAVVDQNDLSRGAKKYIKPAEINQ